MKTRYDQIVDIANIASLNSSENIAEIIAYGKNEGLQPAAQDTKRTLLLVIDVQNDFMENIGSLAVGGSKGDVERLTKWIYSNVEKLTQITCSLDCHSISQIFFADWWINKEGDQPAPFTIITHQDVLTDKWMVANGQKERSLAYLESLESESKKQLCIWPYHCLGGTRGAKLESEFTKMLYYHSAARNSTPTLVLKGQDPYSEMYGIIKAEYDVDNYVNTEVLDAVKEYDAIYIAGEASSHCVLASVSQIVEHFANDRDITSRITVLEDCMSPIGGFEDATVAAFKELKNRYGIKIAKSGEVVL